MWRPARSFIVPLMTVTLTGCSNELDRPIEFVLPDGFTGAFLIIAYPDFADRTQKLPDSYRITVPAAGVVRTRDVSFLRKWHTLRGVYSPGGAAAPVIESSCGIYSDRRPKRALWYWFFVGDSKAKGRFFDSDESYDTTEKWLKERKLDIHGGPAAP